MITGVHPELAAALERIYAAMAAFGHPMKPTEGVRTVERQQALYAQGRTTPGKIVTKCDGIMKRSTHQVKADGFGYAVDSCFVDDPRTPRDESYDPTKPWDAFGALVEAAGLSWGGRFPGLYDQPHAELRR